TGEDRTGEIGAEAPRLPRSGKLRKLWADAAEQSGKRNGREEICLGNTNVRVSGDQILLGLAKIRPPLQQRRGNPGRNIRRVILLGKRYSPGDWAGISAQQQAKRIFLSDNLSLEVGNIGGDIGKRGLCAGHFQARRIPSFEPVLKNVQRVLKTL